MNLLAKEMRTPCLVVDRSRITSNAACLRSRIETLGVRFRPHLKTVKSYEPATYAMESAEGPAAVSTLREAEEFGRKGVTDLLYAIGVAPQKLPKISSLRKIGIELKIVVDSVEAARAVSDHSMATSDPIPTFIEIDVDGQRAGIPLTNKEELIEVGRTISQSAELLGVMTHAGGSYSASSAQELAAAAANEQAAALEMADALKAAGLGCPVISVGSTPTALSCTSASGVTEIRAGVYLFFDLFQAGLGVCGVEDIAMSVLATVIGHQRQKNWIITDAGWTSLSSDRSTAGQTVDQHFGLVCDVSGEPYADLIVLKVNQEHGVLAPRPGSACPAPDLRVGSRVRILPNHACATATQHTEYVVVDQGIDTVDTWPRITGW